jgi:Fur family ferric uptake transcriptional regulator
MQIQNIIKKLKERIKTKNLKYTKQREMVLLSIYNSKSHFNAEDIFNDIKTNNPNNPVAIATIYKSLSFLEKENFIKSIQINNNKVFESSFKKHHDHFICTSCNNISECYDQEIEDRQEDLARQVGFKLLYHTMNLYGICKKCQLHLR